MDDSFAAIRRTLGPAVMCAPPDPVAWNPDGTYTGNPSRVPAGADPWDCRPGRNPYPRPEPGAGFDPSGTRHVQLIRHYERQTFQESILLAGGERGLPEPLRKGDTYRRAELRQAILRRKALLEELGTGVTLLTDEEQALIDDVGDDEEAYA
jgi:hypothetical protein